MSVLRAARQLLCCLLEDVVLRSDQLIVNPAAYLNNVGRRQRHAYVVSEEPPDMIDTPEAFRFVKFPLKHYLFSPRCKSKAPPSRLSGWFPEWVPPLYRARTSCVSSEEVACRTYTSAEVVLEVTRLYECPRLAICSYIRRGQRALADAGRYDKARAHLSTIIFYSRLIALTAVEKGLGYRS